MSVDVLAFQVIVAVPDVGGAVTVRVTVTVRGVLVAPEAVTVIVAL